MKKLLSISIVFMLGFLSAQESPDAQTDLSLQIKPITFNQDYLPFDSENRIFYKSTVYKENDFERSYEWGKKRNDPSTAQTLGNVAAYGIVRGSLFFLGKVIETALTPKTNKNNLAISDHQTNHKRKRKKVRR